jgi:hypothetical protein
MQCAECGVFMSACRLASEQYAAAIDLLHKMASSEILETSEYLRRKAEVDQAREACETARAALRVHRLAHKAPQGLFVSRKQPHLSGPEDLKRSG